ncbi:MAG: Glu-tRNA(Gln) amidotransferase subunit GatE [Candidatus Pacearchaeota archaeon]|jgi:Glu-tRNA(Gln) amidotransferase subunit E-like FAD-binding protein
MDYAKIGLKAGLEIHQQLETHKLFCNCPSVLRSDTPKFEVRRKLHAMAGETGEVDVAVKHEAEKDKTFIYQGYDTTCLVELDEAPPEMINGESIKIALQVAELLNCDIIPATQIMRKTVIDGSNTGGFQRTVLIARNGWVETAYGKVRIATVALEEDAARIIEQRDKETVYRLDRLGIPLLEVSTEPDMNHPEQVKEVALHLGDILRACKVKRGIGTIRQDVNVSILGHSRVEIKGFQDVKMFVKTIDSEIERQLKDKNGKSEVRKANADGTTSFMRPMPGAARMYPETDVPLLFISRDLINEVKSNLPKLRADIKGELKKLGLNDEMINLVVSEGKLDEFKELVQITNDANLVAKMLILWPKELSIKEKMPIEKINEKLTLDVLESILNLINSKKIEKQDVQNILLKIIQGVSVDKALSVEKTDSNELEQEIIKLIKEKPGLSMNAYMGLIMAKFKGKVSGKQVGEILQKYVK